MPATEHPMRWSDLMQTAGQVECNSPAARKPTAPNRERLMNRMFGASFMALGASLFTVQADVA